MRVALIAIVCHTFSVQAMVVAQPDVARPLAGCSPCADWSAITTSLPDVSSEQALAIARLERNYYEQWKQIERDYSPRLLRGWGDYSSIPNRRVSVAQIDRFVSTRRVTEFLIAAADDGFIADVQSVLTAEQSARLIVARRLRAIERATADPLVRALLPGGRVIDMCELMAVARDTADGASLPALNSYMELSADLLQRMSAKAINARRNWAADIEKQPNFLTLNRDEPGWNPEASKQCIQIWLDAIVDLRDIARQYHDLNDRTCTAICAAMPTEHRRMIRLKYDAMAFGIGIDAVDVLDIALDRATDLQLERAAKVELRAILERHHAVDASSRAQLRATRYSDLNRTVPLTKFVHGEPPAAHDQVPFLKQRRRELQTATYAKMKSVLPPSSYGSLIETANAVVREIRDDPQPLNGGIRPATYARILPLVQREASFDEMCGLLCGADCDVRNERIHQLLQEFVNARHRLRSATLPLEYASRTFMPKDGVERRLSPDGVSDRYSTYRNIQLEAYATLAQLHSALAENGSPNVNVSVVILAEQLALWPITHGQDRPLSLSSVMMSVALTPEQSRQVDVHLVGCVAAIVRSLKETSDAAIDVLEAEAMVAALRAYRFPRQATDNLRGLEEQIAAQARQLDEWQEALRAARDKACATRAMLAQRMLAEVDQIAFEGQQPASTILDINAYPEAFKAQRTLMKYREAWSEMAVPADVRNAIASEIDAQITRAESVARRLVSLWRDEIVCCGEGPMVPEMRRMLEATATYPCRQVESLIHASIGDTQYLHWMSKVASPD